MITRAGVSEAGGGACRHRLTHTSTRACTHTHTRTHAHTNTHTCFAQSTEPLYFFSVPADTSCICSSTLMRSPGVMIAVVGMALMKPAMPISVRFRRCVCVCVCVCVAGRMRHRRPPHTRHCTTHLRVRDVERPPLQLLAHIVAPKAHGEDGCYTRERRGHALVEAPELGASGHDKRFARWGTPPAARTPSCLIVSLKISFMPSFVVVAACCLTFIRSSGWPAKTRNMPVCGGGATRGQATRPAREGAAAHHQHHPTRSSSVRTALHTTERVMPAAHPRGPPRAGRGSHTDVFRS
jgi:hypothetical protein